MCLVKLCFGCFGYTAEDDSRSQDDAGEDAVRVEIRCQNSNEKWISEEAQPNKGVNLQFNNKPQFWKLRKGMNGDEWCFSIESTNRELFVACDEKTQELKIVEEGRSSFSAHLRPGGGVYFQDSVTKLYLTRKEHEPALEFVRTPNKNYLWEITQEDGSPVIPSTATIEYSQEEAEEKDIAEPRKKLEGEHFEVIIRALESSESWGGRRARTFDPILVRKYKREQKWNMIKRGNVWVFFIQKTREEGPDLFLSKRGDEDLVFQSECSEEQKEFKATLVGDAIFFSTIKTSRSEGSKFIGVKNRFLTLSSPRDATKWEVINVQTKENIYPSLFE